jgi:hypothetical protein
MSNLRFAASRNSSFPHIFDGAIDQTFHSSFALPTLEASSDPLANKIVGAGS